MEKTNLYFGLVFIFIIVNSCRNENELDSMEFTKYNSEKIDTQKMKEYRNDSAVFKKSVNYIIKTSNAIDEDPRNVPPKK